MPKITTEEVVQVVLKELARAQKKFKCFVNAHEGYAVIKEELDELWGDVKQNKTSHACEEATQIAAMAIRFILDLYDSTILGDAQKRCKATGSREDLQEYLKLRRKVL